MTVQFSIGADPECFVKDKKSVRSVIGKIGGSKHMPRPLPLGDGFAVQEDNVALEFNIPASHSKREFVGNISRATGFLAQMLNDRLGLRFSKESAISFPESEMYDERAFEFGCEPDFNAWTGTVNPRPKCDDRLLRSVGGHVHVGADIDPMRAVKCMDLALSVPAVLMDNGELRKSLYGKAGAFRKTSYGFEYRPLSNFWIFSKKKTGWVYDNTAKALELAAGNFNVDALRDDILEAVDNNNADLAELLVAEYDLQVL